MAPVARRETQFPASLVAVAERLTVRADVAARLPAGMGDLAAAPLLCGGVIGYRALRLSGIRPGERLGLYGFGASALQAIQVARHWGCEVHVASRSAADLDRAARLGAASVGSYDAPPPAPLDAAIAFAPVGSVVVAALRARASSWSLAAPAGSKEPAAEGT